MAYIVPGGGRLAIARRGTRTASVKVWITPALREAIEKVAEREGRSISNWIERTLERAISEEEATRKPPRKP